MSNKLNELLKQMANARKQLNNIDSEYDIELKRILNEFKQVIGDKYEVVDRDHKDGDVYITVRVK